MKKKSLLRFFAAMMAVMLCGSFAACGDDDDDNPATDNPEEQPTPEPTFAVQLYSFELGIGSTLSKISSNLTSEGIEDASYRSRVTNADPSVYESIEYEQYPTMGQAAQGIKEITVILADEYPATTEQLVEYLHLRHYMLSDGDENGVWTFSNTADTNKQKYVLTFTASARKLVYIYVNEPLFLDFSGYLGTDIKKVGWGSVDNTGNFLTYTPHALRDGYVWEVNMTADWAYNNKGQRQNWKAVKTITVEFELNLEDEKVNNILDYLYRVYVYDDMWDGKYSWGYNYHDEAKTMKIYYSHMYEASQKNRQGVEHKGVLHKVTYEQYK